MSFKKHPESRIEMAKNAINATWLICIHNQQINFSNKLKIFAAASQSILMYGAEVWGFKSYEQVNKWLRYFLKKILYLPKNTPNCMLHLETGFSSLFLTSWRLHFGYIKRFWTYKTTDYLKSWQKCRYSSKLFDFLNGKIYYYYIIYVTINNKQVKDNGFFTQSARNCQLHDLYSALKYDVVPYFKDGTTPYTFSLIFKARDGLLNLNTHILNLDSSKACTLCNCHAMEQI